MPETTDYNGVNNVQFLHRPIILLHMTSIYHHEPWVLILWTTFWWFKNLLYWFTEEIKSHLGWPDGEWINSNIFCFGWIIKGAVCRILTLLKHKNTIICLQTFRKHVKLTYLFIWKTMLQSVILLLKMCVRPGMSVFVMVCETRPLPVYPIVFRHPGLPVGGKHSVFHFIHRHVRSFLLVSLIWHPARASSLRRRGWWKKTVSNILNLDCNT